MQKINYVETPSYGVNRAMFFRENKVRIRGKWYPCKSIKNAEVYNGVQRMTLLVNFEKFKSERLYLYNYGHGWVLDNTVTFTKKIK